MLVLTRRPNETIVLPASGVTVRVLSARTNAVRIGIEAPPDVQVLREELLDQSRAAAESGRNAVNQLCPA